MMDMQNDAAEFSEEYMLRRRPTAMHLLAAAEGKNKYQGTLHSGQSRSCERQAIKIN